MPPAAINVPKMGNATIVVFIKTLCIRPGVASPTRVGAATPEIVKAKPRMQRPPRSILSVEGVSGLSLVFIFEERWVSSLAIP